MLDTTRVTEQLAKARAFADQHGLRARLEDRLTYLDEYGEIGDGGVRDKGHSRCTLGYDSAPYSFSLLMEFRTKAGGYAPIWNGALIFHAGPGSGTGGAPEFSVSLLPVREPVWQIHT